MDASVPVPVELEAEANYVGDEELLFNEIQAIDNSRDTDANVLGCPPCHDLVDRPGLSVPRAQHGGGLHVGGGSQAQVDPPSALDREWPFHPNLRPWKPQAVWKWKRLLALARLLMEGRA